MKYDHAIKVSGMEYKMVRNIPVCLECGDKIKYGRADKKFCCEDCRNRHHNRTASEGRSYKRKVIRLLDKNYSILEFLIRSGVTSIDVIDVLAMGFTADVMTSYRITRRHTEYRCFDIKYIMTPARITSISKIQNVSLNLHREKEILKNK